MSAGFRFQRGEPIVIDLVVDDPGQIDPTAVTVTMLLKKGERPSAQTASAAAITSFEADYTAPAGEAPGYWRCTIPSSAEIAVGTYVTDAALSMDGSVFEVTEFVQIRVVESISG